MEREYFEIVSDNSGHKYVIPLARTHEWDAFMAIPKDDERSWDVPEWAHRVEGQFQFREPRIDGKDVAS